MDLDKGWYQDLQDVTKGFQPPELLISSALWALALWFQKGTASCQARCSTSLLSVVMASGCFGLLLLLVSVNAANFGGKLFSDLWCGWHRAQHYK